MSRFSLDDSAVVADEAADARPVAELVARRQLQLAQDGGDVRLDRSRADAQARADALVGIAAREVMQDVALARRQHVELGVGATARRGAGIAERLQHERRQAW